MNALNVIQWPCVCILWEWELYRDLEGICACMFYWKTGGGNGKLRMSRYRWGGHLS